MNEKRWWCCNAEYGEHEPTCQNAALPPVRSEPLLAELCIILSASLARGLDAEHHDCRVLLELPMTEADYMRLREIVEANISGQPRLARKEP